MEPVELEPRPDDGSGGCRAAIALTVAAACLPLMLGVFAPALRVGALAGAAVLLLGAACLMAVLRSSPTERVRGRWTSWARMERRRTPPPIRFRIRRRGFLSSSTRRESNPRPRLGKAVCAPSHRRRITAGADRLHGLGIRSRCRSPRTTGRRSACRQPPFLDVFEVVGVSACVDAGTPRWHPPVLDGRGPLAKAAGAGMVPRLSAAFFVHTGCMRPGG